MIPSLYVLCLDQIVAHIEKVVSLQGVPEEPVLQLFARVLSQGLLSPKVVAVFSASGHDSVVDVIRVRSEKHYAPWQHFNDFPSCRALCVLTSMLFRDAGTQP
jgi:hypothetical protein